MNMIVRLTITSPHPIEHAALEKLQLVPGSVMWNKGDRIEKTDLFRKHYGWKYQLDYNDQVNLGDAIGELLDSVGRSVNLVDISDHLSYAQWEISATIYTIEDCRPACAMPCNLLCRISKLGCDLDFEII
jgi:Domain of unknown function (DUF4279)